VLVPRLGGAWRRVVAGRWDATLGCAMPTITLTLAMNPYDRVLPLVQGEVAVA
jgi:hypothetical protein